MTPRAAQNSGQIQTSLDERGSRCSLNRLLSVEVTDAVKPKIGGIVEAPGHLFSNLPKFRKKQHVQNDRMISTRVQSQYVAGFQKWTGQY